MSSSNNITLKCDFFKNIDKVIKIEKNPIKINLIVHEAKAVNIKHTIEDAMQIINLNIFSINEGYASVLDMLFP